MAELPSQTRLGAIRLRVGDLETMRGFYESTIGKKAIMAVSGLILFSFLIAHMAGNLQIFLGREVMNHYAETLHGNPPLLWTARTILLISAALHIWASIQLAMLKKDARPVAYVKRKNIVSSWASRSMMWTGPAIAACPQRGVERARLVRAKPGE